MTGSAALLLVVHCLATSVMTGVIWFVQLAHYPLLADVGPEQFVRYENENTRRTSWVVGPAMLVEAVTALAILIAGVAGVSTGLAATGVLLLAVIFFSTALVQVPAHRSLSAGFDLAVVSRLVAGNWVRTVAWSARAVIAVAMLLAAIPGPHGG